MTANSPAVVWMRARTAVAGIMADMPRAGSAWLSLRENADCAARSVETLGQVRQHLAGSSDMVIHDLGCGTGSMARWLAPRLSQRQHWIMYDRDRDLLDRVTISASAETRQADITRLAASDLGSADLVTASALLDLLTSEETERIAAACAGVRCLALLTLSVTGRVDLTPPDPLDAEIVAAFNAHQRRVTGDRRLLGPDAVGAMVDAFAGYGATAVVRPSPWQLGSGDARLLSEWFAGWLGAACEQQPELKAVAARYAQRRREEIALGQLAVAVHHDDLFASWE